MSGDRTEFGGLLAPFLVCVLLGYSCVDGSETERFQQLLADDWDLTVRESPLFATRTGDHRFNDRLAKMTLDDVGPDASLGSRSS